MWLTRDRRSYIEKIEIRGNAKTKDRVIRRELAVAPGRSVRHGTRVNLSQKRLEGLNYFEKVDTRPEADGRSRPEKPHRRRGGKEHRQLYLGRGFQFRGFPGGICGIHAG